MFIKNAGELDSRVGCDSRREMTTVVTMDREVAAAAENDSETSGGNGSSADSSTDQHALASAFTEHCNGTGFRHAGCAVTVHCALCTVHHALAMH